MLKNKEIKVCVIVITFLIALACGLLYYYPKYRVLIGLILGAAFLGSFLLYTAYRYRKIAQISEYLRIAANGDTTFDLREYEEGELSFLKSEIYKVTLKLTEQADMLLKDKNYLADTLSDISHQLKTPLTALFVMTDLLKNPDLPAAKREEFTSNIYRQLERIEWLVSSLLKMSKLDANAVLLKKETIEVKKLVEQALEPLRIPMELLAQELRIEGNDNAVFTGDFSWTLEALTNILRNCMEHTPKKGILKITYGGQMVYTWICIEDNGEGISSEDLPHIFERFYKGKNAGPDSVGIGLSMAKQIISRQGGKVEVMSRPGEGTTFTIKFYHQIV